MSRKAASRQKSLGTLQKHGRVWRARWVIDGKLYQKSTGEADRKKALEKLEEFTAPFRAKDSKETLEALAIKVQGKEAELKSYKDSLPALSLLNGFAAFLKTPEGKHPASQTAKMYESQYNRLVDWCKANHPEIKELRQISKKIAREFADHICSQFSANTHNKYITLFSSIWSAIAKQEELDKEDAEDIITAAEARKTARLTCNPWELIAKISTAGSSVSRRELTIEELLKVCSSLEGEMRLLFALGIYTGLRLADCVLMDWGYIDLIKKHITTTPRKTKRKTGAIVTIPIHPALETILLETPLEQRSGYVLPESAAFYKRNSGEFCKSVSSVFERCGIKRQLLEEGKRARCLVGFHSLRHTFVSMAANSGASLELVRQIVGHGNPAMTRHYFHASESALRATINALPALEGNSTSPAAETAPREPTGASKLATLEQLLAEMSEEELSAASGLLAKAIAAKEQAPNI